MPLVEWLLDPAVVPGGITAWGRWPLDVRRSFGELIDLDEHSAVSDHEPVPFFWLSQRTASGPGRADVLPSVAS